MFSYILHWCKQLFYFISLIKNRYFLKIDNNNNKKKYYDCESNTFKYCLNDNIQDKNEIDNIYKEDVSDDDDEWVIKNIYYKT